MNLRQVRKKIKSVGNVKKITKAMQLVSAVKMKKSQAQAIEARPYRSKIESILYRVMSGVDTSSNPFFSEKADSPKDLVIAISANKGLCGAFNVNVLRLIAQSFEISKTDFLAIGKKGATFISHMGGSIVADYTSNTPSSESVAVFELVSQKFLAGEYMRVWLVYNTFISTLRNEAVKEQLLPIAITQKEEENIDTRSVSYLIEPNQNELFQQLVISYLEEKIRGAIQNSEASEHSSRMIAMKNATDNATDVIYTLTSVGNKLRQQKITYELLDMVTSKESVESS